MNRILALFLLALLSGCATMDGLKADIENGMARLQKPGEQQAQPASAARIESDVRIATADVRGARVSQVGATPTGAFREIHVDIASGEVESPAASAAIKQLRERARKLAEETGQRVNFSILTRGNAPKSSSAVFERAGRGEISYVLSTAPSIPRNVTRITIESEG